MSEITLAVLAAQIATMQDEQAFLKAENAQLKGDLAKIAGEALKNEPAKKLEVPKEPLSFKNKKYMWKAAGYQKDGNVITAAEVEADDSLIAEILAIKGQGILVEQL
jgi:hypothetical protein